MKNISKNKFLIMNSFLTIILLLLIIGYIKNIQSKISEGAEIIKNVPIQEEYSDFKIKPVTNENNHATTTKLSYIHRIPGQYVKIINSCDAHFGGVCVNARACPSTSCPVVTQLRDNMVLETDNDITSADGVSWYHIIFSEWIRYPERTSADWYISSKYLEVDPSYKEEFVSTTTVITDNPNYILATSTDKEIIIKLSEQKLYAYEGDKLYLETYISSGLDDLPTPKGVFNIYQKTPSRYMQGPLPNISDQYYDLPGVPWTMYFTKEGAAIHGAYWHNNFGEQWSHGCINLSTEEAETLYNWADLGTKVIVKD